MKKMKSLKIISFILFFIFVSFLGFTQSPTVMVDFNILGRPEAEGLESGYIPWPVSKAASISKTISGVTFSCSSAGSGSGVKSTWYKAGVQTPYFARLVCDGITVDDGYSGGELELKISGLSSGNHSVLLYLNNIDNPKTNTFSPVDIYVNNILKIDNLKPTVRATSTKDATAVYLSFSVSSGQDVVIKVAAEKSSSASNKNVIINGFELNVSNPQFQATEPYPPRAENHADTDSGDITLKWKKAENAVSHDVYIGFSQNEIDNADRSSKWYKGNQNESNYKLSNIIRIAKYFWRVDEVASDGTITKGAVWNFIPRKLAFPGAEGYGRFARGGRGGKVLHVTNLNDSGQGSLRAAVENNDLGPRTIVFDVSGIITLESRLVLNGKYVTVAGQTAPGKGIVVRAAPFGTAGAQDLIIQNVRVRLGAGRTYDGMGMAGSDHCIIDHCSISWTIDESFSSRNGKNITLQRTLISEALNRANHKNYGSGSEHGYAATIGGDIGSFHHNLLAHNAGRNWSLGGGLDGNGLFAGRLDIFNNVVYNWDKRTTDGGAHEVNFVNNYYKPGAASNIFVALNAQYENFRGTQRYYFEGNIMPGYFDENSQGKGKKTSGSPKGYEPWVNKPFFPSYAKIQTAREAYKSVLSDVGCIQPVLDDHDIRVIRETLEGTYTYKGSKTGKPGLPDHHDDVGGYENYPEEKRGSDWDSDNDGLPNWWEKYFGLNINSASGDFSDSNNDLDNDGYTNLDDYLQWMAKPHYFLTDREIVKFDLKKAFVGYTDDPKYSSSNAVNGSVSISSGIAQFTPEKCGMASFNVSVKDSQGASMTKEVVVFVEGNCSGSGISPTPEITPEPTTPVPEVTATPIIKQGDVNDDYNINIVDALLIAQYYVGLKPAVFKAENADVNCDDQIDIVDALLIAKFYVGIANSLAC